MKFMVVVVDGLFFIYGYGLLMNECGVEYDLLEFVVLFVDVDVNENVVFDKDEVFEGVV